MNQALADFLDRWQAQNQIAGYSATILGPDGPLFMHSAGVMNPAGRKPDQDTLFGVGSLSKGITALCACILCAEGRLDLEAPVQDYVPDFRLPGQPAEAVSVRSLLAHRSGLPPMEALEWASAMNSTGRRIDEETARLRASAPGRMDSLAELLSYIAACPHPPVGAPGEHFSYSNEGYAVLSAVIDAAAGQPLEDFMAERVFAPLGMTRSLLDSGVDASRALSGGNLTALFTFEDGAQTCDEGWSILPPYRGCAMVKSTSRDMAAFYRALAAYGLHEGRQAIPREAVELMLGAAHPLSPRPQMCLGLYKRLDRGHVLCEHGGALHGVAAKGALLLGEGIGLALLSNQSGGALEPAMDAMMNAVLGRPLEARSEPFVPSGRAFSAPQMLEGAYGCYEGLPDLLQVFASPELYALRGGETLRLVHCGEMRFTALSADGRLVARLTFLIRDAKAWGVRVGSRIFLCEPAQDPA